VFVALFDEHPKKMSITRDQITSWWVIHNERMRSTFNDVFETGQRFILMHTKPKFITYICHAFVWVALFIGGLQLPACTSPIQPLPDGGLFCEKDDDCAIGSICRFHLCQLPIELHTERNTEPLPDTHQQETKAEQNSWDDACLDGQTRSCYSGTTPPQGNCKRGTQLCANGSWGACKDEVLPKDETCNGIDDDCDGFIDNQDKQGNALTRQCTNRCGEGTERCQDGLWKDCTAPQPNAEECNGKDDDCDGQIDNDIQGPLCNIQEGVCANARKQCGGEKGWLDCSANDYRQHNQHFEESETSCDGKDNDCDGKTDSQCTCLDGDTQSCFSGPAGSEKHPPCSPGTQTCAQGQWGACKGEQLPGPETCNNKDDDCDGQIDNIKQTMTPLQRTCQSKCGPGKQFCRQGQWSACNAPQPTQETCNNKDDDCDGQIDNKLSRACQSQCGTGMQLCRAGRWETCDAPQPTQEICNNKDDNCNGKVDEGLYKTCANACGAGKQLCVMGSWEKCSAPTPSPETCNGKDDDCDGSIDNIKNTPQPLQKACSSICGNGKQLCKGGDWKDCDAPLPKMEVCNNRDDDCDGNIDEGCFQARTNMLPKPSFLPSLSPDGAALALLYTDSTARITRLSDGQQAWTSGGYFVRGLRFASQTIQAPTINSYLLGTVGHNKLKKATFWTPTYPPLPRPIQPVPLGSIMSVSDVHMGNTPTEWYILSPHQKSIWQNVITQTSGLPVIKQTQLYLKSPQTFKTCTPLRLAVHQHHIAVICSGFTWSPQYPSNATLQQLPTPKQQATTPFSEQFLMLIDLKKGWKVTESVRLPSAPLDVVLQPTNGTTRIWVTLAGTPNINKSTNGSIWTREFASTSQSTHRLVPSYKTGTHSRPVGLRVTPQGELLLTVQDYKSNTLTLTSGRLVVLESNAFIRGKWTLKQSLPLSTPPHYLDSANKGTIAVTVSPRKTDALLTTFTKK
tara:strand:- start:212 stop:3097 length:2886 start_codon:yes stop_codon:yes gene_type:complete